MQMIVMTNGAINVFRKALIYLTGPSWPISYAGGLSPTLS